MKKLFNFIYLVKKFRRRYAKSIEEGYENLFLKGFVVMFTILLVYTCVLLVNEIYKSLADTYFNLHGHFSWNPFEYDDGVDSFLELISNQFRPFFLLSYFVFLLAISTQSYPLESAMGWKNHRITYFLVGGAISILPIFIPVVTYTYYSAVAILYVFSGMIIGFSFIIGINIKLYRKSTGDLRKQALYGALAFFLFLVGVVFAMENGYIDGIAQMIDPSADVGYKVDILAGSILELIASYFYTKGFILPENETT